MQLMTASIPSRAPVRPPGEITSPWTRDSRSSVPAVTVFPSVKRISDSTPVTCACHFCRRAVGFDLNQRFIEADRVSDPLEPSFDRRLGCGRRYLRYSYFRRHGRYPLEFRRRLPEFQRTQEVTPPHDALRRASRTARSRLTSRNRALPSNYFGDTSVPAVRSVELYQQPPFIHF